MRARLTPGRALTADNDEKTGARVALTPQQEEALNQSIEKKMGERARERKRLAEKQEELRKAIAANEGKMKEICRKNPNWGMCTLVPDVMSVLTDSRSPKADAAWRVLRRVCQGRGHGP